MPVHQRQLLNARGVAELLSISRTRLFELRKSRYLPSPIELDGSVRWRRSELIDWVRAGCPYAGDWTWRPTLPAKLEQYLSVLREEVLDLQAQIADLEGRKARGENAVTIRAR
jgi:predicted DNA-binding transcriptional regulator AlpA